LKHYEGGDGDDVDQDKSLSPKIIKMVTRIKSEHQVTTEDGDMSASRDGIILVASHAPVTRLSERRLHSSTAIVKSSENVTTGIQTPTGTTSPGHKSGMVAVFGPKHSQLHSAATKISTKFHGTGTSHH